MSKVEVYDRTLTYWETKRRFIRIAKAEVGFFPERKQEFKIIIDGRPYPAQLDKQDRIWAGLFFDILDLKEGDMISFSKNKGSYVLRKK